MVDNLIFDLGFYNGDSSERFLGQGYKVVGVDCNPIMHSRSCTHFKNYIEKGQLILIDKCIDSVDNEERNFYIQPNCEVWSSLNKDIAERVNSSETVKVKTITLRTLIETYGVPRYCKIDIEGHDGIAIDSLFGMSELPEIISCETECLGKNVDPKSHDFLSNVRKLHDLGYTKFFLENQRNNPRPFKINKLEKYTWMNYEEACEYLSESRENFDFGWGPWTFWWDVYAIR